MPHLQTQQKIYELTDSFLVEAKNQDGKERSLDRLNADRHLFVEQVMKVIVEHDTALVEMMIEEVGEDSEYDPEVEGKIIADGLPPAMDFFVRGINEERQRIRSLLSAHLQDIK